MNLRLKAKLLLGLFVMSSLFAQTTVFNASSSGDSIRHFSDFWYEGEEDDDGDHSSNPNTDGEDHISIAVDEESHDITLAILPSKEIYEMLKREGNYTRMREFLFELRKQCSCKRRLDRAKKESEVLEEFLKANPDVVRAELEHELHIPLNMVYETSDAMDRYLQFMDPRSASIYGTENATLGECDENGNNLLHLIAKDGNPDMIRAFVSAFLDFELDPYDRYDHYVVDNMLKTRNREGDMPFHVAACSNNFWFIETILRSGCCYSDDLVGCLSAKTDVAKDVFGGSKVKKDVIGLIKDEFNFHTILSVQSWQNTGDIGVDNARHLSYAQHAMEMVNRYIHDNR